MLDFFVENVSYERCCRKSDKTGRSVRSGYHETGLKHRGHNNDKEFRIKF